MQHALGACVLVGIVCGVVGVFVVLRGMAYFGDALAHSMLPGLAAGYLVHGALGGGAVLVGDGRGGAERAAHRLDQPAGQPARGLGHRHRAGRACWRWGWRWSRAGRATRSTSAIFFSATCWASPDRSWSSRGCSPCSRSG
jgi:hypothetical protein